MVVGQQDMNKVFETKKTLNLGGTLIDLTTPAVMGILNVTPDSFFDGGRYASEKEILLQAEKMLSEGAAIIDIGGYSTRPGAAEISEKEEFERVIPVIRMLIKNFTNIKISIDTFRSVIAEAALTEGAVMINDVSGGTLDEKMFDVVKKFKPVYVLMHMRGNPKTMKNENNYTNIILDIVNYLQEKLYILRSNGLHDVIIDPGFGFAKNISQNFEILKNLSYLMELNCAILVGVSRKSMIYNILGIKAGEALNGTTTLNTIALMNGANILRVHDVKEAIETVKLFKATIL